MTDETRKLMEDAHRARAQFKVGSMGREEAYAIVGRYIDHANEKGKEIAKRYGVRHKTMTVTSFMR